MSAAITLRGVAWDHPRATAPLLASIPEYRQLRAAAGQQVEIVWEARSLKDFGDAPIDELAQRYDLLIIDHPHIGVAAQTGCLLPLETLLDAELLDVLASQSAGPSHASYHEGGHQWALAIDAATQAAAYRSDLLDEGRVRAAGQSWDAALELARQLRGEGLWAAVPLAPTDAVCGFLSLCASLGEAVGTGEGGWVSQSVALAALTLLRRWRDLSCPDAWAWNPIQTFDAMSRRSDLAYCPLAFIYSNYARNGFRPHLLRFADLPGVRGSCLGGTGVAVSAFSQFRHEAARYAAWLCSAGVQSGLYVRCGGQPGNALAWTNAEANALTHDFFRDTLATVTAAHVRPRGPGWPPFQEEAGNAIHAWLLADQGDAAALSSRLRDAFFSGLHPASLSSP
ncbi:hypothetical protein [Deinococcus sp.]|uniref:hypothetical protein n=1 Tax=Deinococcus sp. TaxID=47478 RepID=UPI003CC62773